MRVFGRLKPERVMKVKVEISVVESTDARTRAFAKDLRYSMRVGTRKMVNYA